jgi:hypothetical protein
MIKYVKADADNSTTLEEVADLINYWSSGIVGDWQVVTNKFENYYYSDIYYKNELVAFVYWDETLYTFTTDKNILNQLYTLKEFEVYEWVVDCSNPIDNVYITHILSTMTMNESYFLVPTKELAIEVKERFQDLVYNDSGNYDENWVEFDSWINNNGIIMLIDDDGDFTNLPHNLLEVGTDKYRNAGDPSGIYKRNVVADWVERF